MIQLKDFSESNFHSYIFKKYLQEEKREMNDWEKFNFYKNSEFNFRFNMRSGKRTYEPINESYRFQNQQNSEIEKLNTLLNQTNFASNNQTVKLSHMYDKNLNLLEEYQ